jgi:NitT/TauT family transport system substrate-binding protein
MHSTRKFRSVTSLSAIILLLIATILLNACGDQTATSAATTSTAATTSIATTTTNTTTGTTSSAATGTSAATTTGTLAAGTVRLGYFPNLTHPQALVGLANGTFAAKLGSNVKLDAKSFNAGPAAVEALLAGDIDMTYVGPNPAINAYIKTKGQGVRIIAGAASGGVSFVVRPDSNINTAKDLANKKLATPQLGNTQDVALRNYLVQNGLQSTDKGGNVQIVPTDNANILQLFANKQIDGAWVPEPWATRLVVEDKGRVFLDERSLWPDGKFVITVLLVNTKFLNARPDLVKAVLDANLQITQDIQKDPIAAKKAINDQLKTLTGKALAPEVLAGSFDKMQVLYDPLKDSLVKSADAAFAAGFLGKDKPNLDNLYDLKILNSLLTEKGLPTIQ